MVFEHHRSLRDSACPVNNGQGKLRLSKLRRARPGPPTSLIRKDRFRSVDGDEQQPRRVGYIRVSTKSQFADRQVVQLEAECDELHLEQISAVAAERPVFEQVIEELQPGDTFVVVDLDRAFRSSIDAIMTAQSLRDRHIRIRVLSFPIDTASEEGELFYTILAAFAQFERRIISRRTKEGLEAARRRGARLGRPARLTSQTILDAHGWMRETGLPCAYVSALLGVSRLTLQRGFHRLGLTYPL